MIKMKNPNAFPIGKKFGFFICGGDCWTRTSDLLRVKYAKEGWRILDTHLGSGSSRIAAYNLGFEFVGCEIEPTYFQLQEQRFADHTAQERMW